MKLLITGVNHRTAPVDVRERLSFDHDRLAIALREIKTLGGVHEGMILSTCNRVEVTLATDDSTQTDGLVASFLTRTQQVESAWLEPHLYHFQDEEAIRHLFRVASSLDSMVVGEPQILGQLKAAYAEAKAHGAITGFLEAVLTRSFSVAKRVRTETAIGESAVSISYTAVELARQIFGRLDKKSVMILGAGKMSELAARHLRRAGASDIFVTNRTHDRAIEMARTFNGKVVAYDRFRQALPNIDILITSSGAPHYILKKDDVRTVLEARRNRPVFLIDIAVPRNIEPAVNELDNVFLYDIDDLQQVVDENLKARMKEAQEAEAIIEEEVERMVERLKSHGVKPMIVGLQQQLEAVRAAELERYQGKLSSLSPEQKAAVEALTRGIINKIAHGSIAELRRQATNPNGFRSVEVIRRVFRLDD